MSKRYPSLCLFCLHAAIAQQGSAVLIARWVAELTALRRVPGFSANTIAALDTAVIQVNSTQDVRMALNTYITALETAEDDTGISQEIRSGFQAIIARARSDASSIIGNSTDASQNYTTTTMSMTTRNPNASTFVKVNGFQITVLFFLTLMFSLN